MIKAQSLGATLPVIIFIHDVYISLQEQDYREGVDIYEHYKTYKYKTQLEFEFDLYYHDSQ